MKKNSETLLISFWNTLSEVQFISSEFLQVESYIVKLCAEKSINQWVYTYLRPLVDKVVDQAHDPNITIKALYSDEIITQFSLHVTNSSICLTKGQYLSLSIGTFELCYDSVEGIMWLYNKPSKELYFVYSTRTRWASHEFARTVREVLSRYLGTNNWIQYHAGCVETPFGGVLIIGDKGKGKTTLTLALTQLGCQYVSNERTYVTLREGNILAMGYPITIGLGLGTAMQFSQIRPYITSHYQFLFPRIRYDFEKIRNTNPMEWAALEDKLDILPHEFTNIMGLTPPIQKTEIKAILVPNVSKTQIPPKVDKLNLSQIKEVLDSNIFLDDSFSAYPEWINMGGKLSQSNLDEVSKLPSYRVTFNISENVSNLNLLKELERGVNHGVY